MATAAWLYSLQWIEKDPFRNDHEEFTTYSIIYTIEAYLFA